MSRGALRAAVAVVVTLACAETKGPPTRDSAASPLSPSAAPALARDTGAREIYIDSVSAGNPVVVRGRARTFENTVQVRARDASGAVLAEVFTTSTGEIGRHNPFTAQVWLTRDPGSQVTVEAFEYSANDGAVRSLTSNRVPIAEGRTRITLAFATSDCAVVKDFTRDVPATVAVARLLVEALVAGPTSTEKAAGAAAPFPAGARVRTVVLRNGQLAVDFNERMENVGGACAAQAIRTSLTRTLERLPSVTSVVISAMGSTTKALQP